MPALPACFVLTPRDQDLLLILKGAFVEVKNPPVASWLFGWIFGLYLFGSTEFSLGPTEH